MPKNKEDEEFEREEVPTQDDRDRVFDMTAADSPDEVDIDEVRNQ